MFNYNKIENISLRLRCVKRNENFRCKTFSNSMMQGQIHHGVGDTESTLWKSKYQLLSALKTVELVYNHIVFITK